MGAHMLTIHGCCAFSTLVKKMLSNSEKKCFPTHSWKKLVDCTPVISPYLSLVFSYILISYSLLSLSPTVCTYLSSSYLLMSVSLLFFSPFLCLFPLLISFSLSLSSSYLLLTVSFLLLSSTVCFSLLILSPFVCFSPLLISLCQSLSSPYVLLSVFLRFS
jgi:hypothetical protein